jgi:hypothetical protein
MDGANLVCPKCKGEMIKGFQLDHGHGGRIESSEWTEGKPQRSYWLGIVETKGRVIEITSYRCEKCGYLESYAN